jgi:hypothetical protein
MKLDSIQGSYHMTCYFSLPDRNSVEIRQSIDSDIRSSSKVSNMKFDIDEGHITQ